MLAVVVAAHPTPDSFCHALAARAASGLRAAGHEVAVMDLYRDGFQAAMNAEERRAYDGDTPILDPLVADYAALVRRAEALVFVYPTWWAGHPAILKGWLERVLVPGVAFRFDERTNGVRPGLGNVRHIVGISTYGSPRSYVRLLNDNGRRILTRALRMSCGVRARTRWYGLYAMDTATQSDREEFAARIERDMAGLR
jgi:NAD(P)H dehydrogenase (quinone)